jgi:hypothetical protein
MLTFKISSRPFLHDEFASSNGSANGTADQRQWVLLIQAKRKGTAVAASPIIIAREALRPGATRVDETRDGRIQVGATPRGSVVVTAKRARRLPLWHRSRLVS